MKREDLRSRIIPTTIDNTDESQNTGNKKFDTTDLIYLDSYNEQYDGKKTDEERRISATDYAKMNNITNTNKIITRTGKEAAWKWLRSACPKYGVYSVRSDGGWINNYTSYIYSGLCPSLHYQLPSDISERSVLRFFKRQKYRNESEEIKQFNIREVKDINRRNYISYITNW